MRFVPLQFDDLDELERLTGLHDEPGWHGTFTRWQADGAIGNGTKIVKTQSEPGDNVPNGTQGVVLGSISNPDVMDGKLAYFVEWFSQPQYAVLCMGWKITPA